MYVHRHSTYHTPPVSLRTVSTVKLRTKLGSLYRVHPHIGLSPSMSLTQRNKRTWERFPFFRRGISFFSAECEFLWNRGCIM